MVVSLLLKIPNAKADSSFTFFNNEVTGVYPNSTSTGNLVFSRTPDNVSGKSFLFVDVCANSSFDIEVVSNTTGLIYPLGKSYLTNKSCELINGYMGNVYRFIFIIGSFGYTQADYIIDGSNSSDIEFGTLTTAYLRSQIKVTNTANYYSYFNFYDYGISDTPPLEDLIYENDLTQTAILRDILNTLKEISVSSNAGVTEAINNQTKKIEEQIKQVEEIKDMDIDASDKELPDDSKYQDYQDSENSLKDKVNQADLNYLEIGMDDKSSLFIWDTITRIIKSHPAIFAMVTSILSIGIIKLALGR